MVNEIGRKMGKKTKCGKTNDGRNRDKDYMSVKRKQHPIRDWLACEKATSFFYNILFPK